MPVQQRQFCAAYREDAARHHEYEAKVAAAPNPIARLNVEKTEPKFEKLFHAKQAEVIADGSFQDWTGLIHIKVNRHYSQSDGRQDQGQVVIVKVEFPCIWTDYGYETGKRQNYSYGHRLREESLQLGNGFDGWPRYGDPPDVGIGYIPLESAFGQSLSALSQDEPVAVSGNLICTTDKGCLTNGGYGGSHLLLGNITAVRSLKTGKVFKPPVPTPLILSHEVPFESIDMNFYLFFNQEAETILERYTKQFDNTAAKLRTLREGTRYIPLMKTPSEPVTIKGAAGPYILIAVLDDAGKINPYAMIPNFEVPAEELPAATLPTQSGAKSFGGDNVPAANRGVRATTSENKQQRLKVCRNERVFASPPVGAAVRGSGRLIGTAETGDEALVLEMGERVSKVQFDHTGQKVTGWLANGAFCPSQNSGRIDTASTSISGPAVTSVPADEMLPNQRHSMFKTLATVF